MSPIIGLSLIGAYFLILIFVSFYTSRGPANSDAFFTGNRNSKWYLVAFGMIGTSLSGVTFISVPGMVKSGNFHYLQMVFGYLIGYLVIGLVLMPLYYRLNLVSIYTYLEQRFGYWSYKTGSAFFLISRLLGSSARFFLVMSVLHHGVFAPLGLPFPVSVGIGLLLIWVYTFKGGIKTIVVTDTLQTIAMLTAVSASIIYLMNNLSISFANLPEFINANSISTIWSTDTSSKSFWLKQVLAGAFIAITMTGLDQDMMQKNLTCRNIGEAQKNMFFFSAILLVVNVMFLVLGLLLYSYADFAQIELPAKSDKVFPFLAFSHFPLWVGIMFLTGIIAATYASTDSALAALTTSFCFDFLNFNQKQEAERQKQKLYVHLAMSATVWLLVLIFDQWNQDALITTVFELAGLTYGPLLGMYAFGLFFKAKLVDKIVPIIAILSVICSYLLKTFSKSLFGGYEIGFEILLINGAITMILMGATSVFNIRDKC